MEAGAAIDAMHLMEGNQEIVSETVVDSPTISRPVC
jgi:hypothetical protein